MSTLPRGLGFRLFKRRVSRPRDSILEGSHRTQLEREDGRVTTKETSKASDISERIPEMPGSSRPRLGVLGFSSGWSPLEYST